MSSGKVIIFIKTVDDLQNAKLDRLNLTDNLPNIRKELEKYNIINDMLLFSKKFPKNDKNNNEFAEIAREKEKEFLLENIIEVFKDENSESHNILYLIKTSRPSWNILNDKYKLDYGRTMSFDGIKNASKKAFTIKDCKLKEINAEGYRKGKLVFDTREDWIKKTNLFINFDDINVTNFAKLGLSVGGSQNENFNEEIGTTYQYIELGKVSLELKDLKVTEDLKIDVNYANDHRDFRKITEEYGQFISTEIVLGGRVYFKDVKVSSTNYADNVKGGSVNLNVGPSGFQIGGNYGKLKRKSKFYSFNHMRFLGGKHPDDEGFNEKAWIESLKDYQNWECIEFKNPISIFQLLPDDLRKKTFESIGKRILHMSTEDCAYRLDVPGRPKIHELNNLPPNVEKIILNEEADCNVFATVIDTETSRDDFFTCQIFSPPKAKPRLIVHGIQKNFQPRLCKLKIRLMVIGYDIDFNVILSDISVELKRDNYDSKKGNIINNTSQLEYDLISRNIPFLGIPVLSNFDSSNEFLVVGHNFFNAQDQNRIGSCTFSYCLKTNHCVNLPNFTFCAFIFLDPNAYKSRLFKFNNLNLMRKRPFIDLEDFDSQSPKYISLYLSKDSNYGPIFLNQKIKQINIEYVDCNCKKTCLICKNKPIKISKNENYIECIFFDPNISE